jgi:uncharacterized protein
MQARSFGRIINVASIAGLVPSPAGATLYGGAKAMLIKFTQALNAENQSTGVHVSALCPGFTRSEFHDVNGMREMVSQMPGYMWMEARPVVEAGFDGAERNLPTVVPGAINKGVTALAKLLPDPLGNAMVRSQASKFRSLD